jgi:glutathione S-transferase
MKIYSHPQVPNPRRLRVFIAEKGLNIPYEDVDNLRRKESYAGVPQKEPGRGLTRA